jgi:hypothetical protein
VKRDEITRLGTLAPAKGFCGAGDELLFHSLTKQNLYQF